MNLSDLLKERKVEEISVNKDLVKRTFDLALRDIKTANNNLIDKDFDWALAIAYNAMLQAGKAAMYSKGYRPLGHDKHRAVIEFIEIVLNKKIPEEIILSFDRFRKKRHRLVYEEANITSESEAMFAIKTSEEFVQKIKEILKT
jgi:uncharacterized protein (UPF0332 family)